MGFRYSYQSYLTVSSQICDIFSEGQMEEMADTVDGVTGEQEIADAFAEIFKKLYNSSGSEVEMTEL